MSSRPADERTTTAAFDVLARPQRRYLLAELLEDGESPVPEAPVTTAAPTPIERLATEVAADVHDKPIVTDEQCLRTHMSLVHAHVPRLADVGVVTRTKTGDTTTVALADHPIVEAEWVRQLLANPTDGTLGDEARLNRTCEVLASAQRRAALCVLARQRGSVPVADLAAQVAAQAGGDDRRLVDVSESEWTDTRAALVHTHLPALVDAGLVEYDRAGANEDGAGTVAIAADAPQWNTDWLAASPLGEVTDRLESSGTETGSTRSDGGDGGDGRIDAASAPSQDTTNTCSTIEGATNVLDTGRTIVDSAEDELLVMLPSERLVRQQCLEHWRGAVDRGVDVYVGSQSTAVRETVRAAVPGATVCEPRFDWLNVPVEQVHHGHVILADRERVMLVTIDEGTLGSPRVAALTGEGADDVLVSLVCEHVGPRLDRLADRRDESGQTDGASALPM